MGIVTAVGLSVNSPHGESINKRLEKAMANAVLACNAEGITTEEKNSAVIRERVQSAYAREMALIEEENRGNN